MANVKFIIRPSRTNPRKADNNPTSIILIYHLSDKRGAKLTHPTGYKIKPKFWDTKNQKVKNLIEATGKDEINNGLNELKTAFEIELNRRVRDKEPTAKEALKSWLVNFSKPDKIKMDNSFHGYFKTYIDRAKNKISPATGKPIVYTTVRKYHQCYNAIKDFEKATKTRLTWESINLDFYEDFINYLQDVKNQSLNNIGKHIKTLKVVMNEATERGINTNTSYQSRKFKAPSENVMEFALTEEHLKEMIKLNLSKNKRLEQVRDIFIIGCYTGLRFSDFTHITSENIKQDEDGKYIEIKQRKTGQYVAPPINNIVETIIDKYKGHIPKPLSNQKFNKYIKEVSQMAGLSEIVTKTRTQGKEVVTIMQPLYTFIKSHTARRTFATNMYRNGVPAISIMAITGHKTEKEFLRYLKITPKEHSKIARKHLTLTGKMGYMKVINQ